MRWATGRVRTKKGDVEITVDASLTERGYKVSIKLEDSVVYKGLFDDYPVAKITSEEFVQQYGIIGSWIWSERL